MKIRMFNLFQSPRINLLYMLNLVNLLCINHCKTIEFFQMKLIIVPINNFDGLMPLNSTFCSQFYFCRIQWIVKPDPPIYYPAARRSWWHAFRSTWKNLAISTTLILLDVESNNRRKLPWIEVEASLSNYPNLWTDENRWIEISRGGEPIWWWLRGSNFGFYSFLPCRYFPPQYFAILDADIDLHGSPSGRTLPAKGDPFVFA